MEKKITFKDIVKSKYFRDKEKTSWNQKRLDICNSCPFNSKNREKLTLKEKAMVTVNGGADTCLACGCEIEAKTSLKHAKCPLTPPKWDVVRTIAKTAALEIENISTTPLKVREEKGELWLDYGTIKIGQDTDVRLELKDLKNEITDMSIQTTCGCTKTNLKDNILEIVYDTKRVGPFTKTVILTYIKNNTPYKSIIKITGKTK